ncbi:MAG: papain-like cysteine protease family protein [Nitrospirota bacterium]
MNNAFSLSLKMKSLLSTIGLLGFILIIGGCTKVDVRVTGFCCSSSDDDLPPGPSCDLPEKSLTIERYDQETISWCWAASAQMVINYFRTAAGQPQLTQCSIVDDLLTPPETCCGPDKNSDSCLRGDLPENVFVKKGFTYAPEIKDPSSRENLWGKVTSQICEEKPLILAEYFVGGGGHSSVIYGFGGNGQVGERWVDLYDHIAKPIDVEQVNYDNEIYFVDQDHDNFGRLAVYYTFDIQPQ